MNCQCDQYNLCIDIAVRCPGNHYLVIICLKDSLTNRTGHQALLKYNNYGVTVDHQDALKDKWQPLASWTYAGEHTNETANCML